MGDVPAILYHYTSFDAFRNIMESEIIRAIHYSELSDWREIEMGRKMVECSLRTHASGIRRDTMRLLKSQVDALGKGELPTFVFSLSEDRDSLDQWRAYCRDGGVAIGFMGKGLDAHFREASRKTKDGGWSCAAWQLVQCQYHTRNDSIDTQAIVSNADRLNIAISQETEKWVRGAKATLRNASSFSQIEELCCSTKHCAYESEKEWRCFLWLGEKTPLAIQLDESNRRFVEMPFVASDAIKEVVISPHGGRRQDRTLAQYFKNSMNLSYEIIASEIPFRT